MIQSLSGDTTPKVNTLVHVDPDKLIELGHKLKQHAMDFALQGESLTVALTDKILLIYEPGTEYCKPTYTFTPPAILTSEGERLQ